MNSVKELDEEIRQLRQQLDTERENTQIAQKGARKQLEKTLQLREQLTVEREKAEKVYADCAERIVELEAAAIKESEFKVWEKAALQIEQLRNLLKKVEPFVEAWAMEDLLGEIREELMKQ